jgi:O-antigen/teichoic acid export membrane protein
MNFARNFRSLLSATIVTSVLGLALSVALARWLSETERGVYAVVMTMSIFVEFAAQLGQRASLIYRIGRAGVPRDVALGAALKLTLSALGVTLALCLAASAALRERVLAGAGMEFLVVALALGAVEAIAGLFEALARAIDRFELRNRALIATSLLSLAAVSLVLLALHGGALAALTALLAARAVVALWLIVASLRETGFTLRGSPGEVAASLRFGFPSYLQTLIGKLHERADVILLALLRVEPAQIAVYAVAVGVIDRLRVMPDAVGSALLPKLTVLPHDEAGAYTSRVVRNTLFWVCVTAIGLGLVAPLLLPLVFGRAYAASLVPLLILLPATVSLTVRRVLSNYFTASGWPGFNASVQAAAAVLNIAVNLWAIPRYGIAGAAFASLISYGFEGAATVIGFRSKSGQRVRDTLLPKPAEIAEQIGRAQRKLLGFVSR